MKILKQVLFFLLSLNAVHAQKAAHLVRPSDTLNKDPFINTVEQSLRLFYADYVNKNEYDSIIKALKKFSLPLNSSLNTSSMTLMRP